MSSCLFWANNSLCKWEISIFLPQRPFFKKKIWNCYYWSVLTSCHHATSLLTMGKVCTMRVWALWYITEFRQRTCLFPSTYFEAGQWHRVFLRRKGLVGCKLYSLKITAFKLMLRRRKDVTIEHKWILCKKLETEIDRYDLTYRINTTGTWFIDYGLSHEKASASWKAQSKVVFFSL